MKIVTYTYNQSSALGLLIGENIYPLNAIASTMNDFLQMGESAMGKAKIIEESILKNNSKL